MVQTSEIPTVSLVVGSTADVLEVDIADSAGVICKLVVSSAQLGLDLPSFRASLQALGVVRIPKHFMFAFEGSLVAEEEEAGKTLQQIIISPPTKHINANFFGTNPRISLFPREDENGTQDPHSADAFGRTLLHDAVMRGDMEAVRQQLTAGASVPRSDHRGQTAFHIAAAVGNVDLLRLLREHVEAVQGPTHFQSLLERPDKSGRTPLLTALTSRKIPTAALLLSWGAVETHTDAHGASGVDMVRKLGMDIHSAVRNKDMALVEIHVARYGQVAPPPQPPSLMVPMHDAAEIGNVEAMRVMLAAGWDACPRDAAMQTPLHLACARGHLEICEQLLSSSASAAVNVTAAITATDKSGRSALHRACERFASPNQLAILRLLIKTLIEANRLDLLISADANNRTPLHVAAASGWEEGVKELLSLPSTMNVDVDGATTTNYRRGVTAPKRGGGAVDNGGGSGGSGGSNDNDDDNDDEQAPTPASIAYIGGKTACFQLLLQAGAKISSAQVLKVAVQRGDSAIVQAIISNNSDNVVRLIKHTPYLLHDAIQGNFEDIQIILLSACWDPLARNPSTRQTAFEAAGFLHNDTGKDSSTGSFRTLLLAYLSRVPRSSLLDAIPIACENDCDQSLSVILEQLIDDDSSNRCSSSNNTTTKVEVLLSALYTAAGAGAPRCTSVVINRCYGVVDWVAGRTFWINPGSHSTSCPQRECCRLSSPLLYCLHTSLPIGHGTKPERYAETAMVLVNAADESLHLGVSLVRMSCSAGCNALHLAASNGMWELCNKLVMLDPSSLHVPLPVSLNTPLHLAIVAGAPAVRAALYMIEQGAPLLARNAAGLTPLQLARIRHNEELMLALRQALDQLRDEIDKDWPRANPATTEHVLGPSSMTKNPVPSPSKHAQHTHGSRQHFDACDTSDSASAAAAAAAAAGGSGAASSGEEVRAVVWEENGDEAEIIPEADGLASCGYCGRRFLPERLATHRHACKKTSRPKRPSPPLPAEYDGIVVVDLGEGEGPGHLVQCLKCSRSFFPRVLPHHVGANTCKPGAPTAHHQPDDVKETTVVVEGITMPRPVCSEKLAAGRGFVAENAAPAVPPTILPDGRWQCPNCARGFNQDRIDKHITVCKGTTPRHVSGAK